VARISKYVPCILKNKGGVLKSWKVKIFSSKIFFPLFRARVPQFARRRFAAFSFAHLRAYLSIAFRTFVWYG